MAFEIPDPYKWDDSFKVMYANLDAEHNAVFESISKYANDAANAGLLSAMYSVIEDHFKTEEGMMESAKYSDLKFHTQIHNDFLAKLKTLKAPLDAASIKWLKEWFVGHIKGIDFKYKGKL